MKKIVMISLCSLMLGACAPSGSTAPTGGVVTTPKTGTTTTHLDPSKIRCIKAPCPGGPAPAQPKGEVHAF